MSRVEGGRAERPRFSAWFPPVFFALVALGTLPVIFTHLFVPSAVAADSVAAMFGREYAVVQLTAFDRNPYLVHGHAVVGLLLVLAAPFQFWRGFRNRHRRLHRWMGYGLAVAVSTLAISGVAVAVVYPFSGLAGVIPNLIWATGILTCTGLAIANARRRDILAHEAWITRAMAMTFGVTFASLYIPVLTDLLHVAPRPALAISFWLGVVECLAVAEVWLRRNGPRPMRRRAA